MKAGRLTELDRAKGLGIFLVVLGHVTGREVPADWYGHLKFGIYAFHMPVFFFLSGLTFGMGHLAREGTGSWLEFVRSRARRLIPAYIGMACMVFAGKWAASQFLHIHRAPVSLEDFLVVFTHPTLSFCGFLWYVYALFISLVLASAFAKLAGRWGAPAFLAFSIVLAVSHEWTFFLEMRRTVEGLPWLALGWLMARHYDVFKQVILKAWWVFGIVFFALLWPYAMLEFGAEPKLVRAVICLTGIAFVYGIASILPDRQGRGLERLGSYSFTIYLFNVLVIGLATAAWDIVLPKGAFVDLQMIIMTVLALGLPIALYKLVKSVAPGVAAYIK